MPRIEAAAVVPVPPADAFAVSQMQGPMRWRWDPFVRRQRLLDGATRPAKGVRTWTRSRHGLNMVSEYVAFNPPKQVGMRMVEGPWFFEQFSGGWAFSPDSHDGATTATWRYTFSCKPLWLAGLAHAIGTAVLGRDIRRRIHAFATACTDPDVLAEARRQAALTP